MDAESQLLAEKDAEIERLKRENAQLKKWNLMTDEQVVMDLKSEIERLKAILDNEQAEMRIKNVLITELCDALNHPNLPLFSDLRRRAREATK